MGENGKCLWNQVPKEIINSVICEKIGEDTLSELFEKVEALKGHDPIDIIIGGPPCQAYSVAGRARLGKAIEKDPRNELYKFYVKFLAHFQPRMFVFENVLGILTAKGGEPFRDLQRLVRELGYDIDFKRQIASDYGVLQHRERVIIIGWKITEKGHPSHIIIQNCPKFTKNSNLCVIFSLTYLRVRLVRVNCVKW